MMPEMKQKIVIELRNGLKLIAAQSNDPNYKNEIAIGVMKNGVWYQDLAIVRSRYKTDAIGTTRYAENEFEVLVYADKNDEDYTDSFPIDLYEDGE